jgi:hypothetical protein
MQASWPPATSLAFGARACARLGPRGLLARAWARAVSLGAGCENRPSARVPSPPARQPAALPACLLSGAAHSISPRWLIDFRSFSPMTCLRSPVTRRPAIQPAPALPSAAAFPLCAAVGPRGAANIPQIRQSPSVFQVSRLDVPGFAETSPNWSFGNMCNVRPFPGARSVQMRRDLVRWILWFWGEEHTCGASNILGRGDARWPDLFNQSTRCAVACDLRYKTSVYELPIIITFSQPEVPWPAPAAARAAVPWAAPPCAPPAPPRSPPLHGRASSAQRGPACKTPCSCGAGLEGGVERGWGGGGG